jgi:hypothetical protein
MVRRSRDLADEDHQRVVNVDDIVGLLARRAIRQHPELLREIGNSVGDPDL